MASESDDVLREYYILRLVQWRDAVERLDAATVAAIGEELKKFRARMGREIADSAEQIAVNGGLSREQWEGLDRWLDDSIKETAAAITAGIATPALTIGAASAAMAGDMFSLGGRVHHFAPVGVTNEMLADWFSQSPHLAGLSLGGWVEKTFADGVKAELFDALLQADVQGWGYGKTAKSVLGKALDMGITVTQREISTLARTYIQTANVGAMNAVYETNAALIPALRWTTAGDNHVCPLCAPLDGHVYKQGERRPPMPRHHQCRCLMVPVPKSFRGMGLNMDDIEAVRRWNIRERGDLVKRHRRVLDTVTMKGTYADWWQTLPQGMQNSILGPVRSGLIREGKLSWGQLVNFKTGKQYTLEELGF